jgi:hypothetical protein
LEIGKKFLIVTNLTTINRPAPPECPQNDLGGGPTLSNHLAVRLAFVNP